MSAETDELEMSLMADVGIPTAGWSDCPMCGCHWLVSLLNDCMVPACGCYGTDVSASNPARPCESCGLRHAWSCDRGTP